MPEQDYVTIPNQPGTSGLPTNAQIAADDLSGSGTGPFVQQVSLANLTSQLRILVQELSVLGTAQDGTGTGRIRVLVDSITGALTLANLTSINSFGPANTATTLAHYMPLDILSDTWNNSVRRNIT